MQKPMVFLVNSPWHQSILCLTSRWSYYVLHSNLGFIPICEPWCWYIYLQNWVIYGVNVAKYSSTMEHLVSYSLPVEKWWHQRWSEKLWTDLGDLRYQAGCPLRFFSKPCLITGGSTIATPPQTNRKLWHPAEHQGWSIIYAHLYVGGLLSNFNRQNDGHEQ